MNAHNEEEAKLLGGWGLGMIEWKLKTVLIGFKGLDIVGIGNVSKLHLLVASASAFQQHLKLSKVYRRSHYNYNMHLRMNPIDSTNQEICITAQGRDIWTKYPIEAHQWAGRTDR